MTNYNLRGLATTNYNLRGLAMTNYNLRGLAMTILCHRESRSDAAIHLLLARNDYNCT